MANALAFGLPQPQDNPLSPIPSAPTFGAKPKPQMGTMDAVQPRPSNKVNPLTTMAPKAAPQMAQPTPQMRKSTMRSASPNVLAALMPQQKKPDAMYAFMDSLQRSVDPAGAQAREQRMTADQQTKLQQSLAYVQHMQGMPMEQRLAFAQQMAPQMGIDAAQFDASKFTDEALAASVAALSSHLGIAPEAPEYMNLGGGAVGMTRGGQFSMVREAPQERAKPIEVNGRLVDPNTYEVLGDYSDQETDQPEYTYENFDGAVWAVDKRDPMKRVRLGSAPQGTQAAPPDTFRSLSPDEVAARGYPEGTVVQVDGRGREYVNSRPSTQQTGQPTEGERAAGLHAGIAINGLRNLTEMEQGQGYNRAGGWEQAGGLVGGEKERLYDQAAAEFIDGYLRAMTGAAATKDEIATYRAQWFPQFGDTPNVVQQKAEGRLNAIRQMKSKTGRSWNPEWDAVIADLERQVGGGAQQQPTTPPQQILSGPAPAGLPPELKTVWNANPNPVIRGQILAQLNPQQLQQLQQSQLPPGVTQEMWDVMDEEDRAAFQ